MIVFTASARNGRRRAPRVPPPLAFGMLALPRPRFSITKVHASRQGPEGYRMRPSVPQSSRYSHLTEPQLRAQLDVARTKVQWAATSVMRGRAMQDVEMVRSELLRRGVSE